MENGTSNLIVSGPGRNEKNVSISQDYGLLAVDEKWQQSTAQREVVVSFGATVQTFSDETYMACILN
jgi:hypothetical protein